ncbi:MAG: hypothetical protein QXM31_00505 [Candidatus Woesearchaeota archaeon]
MAEFPDWPCMVCKKKIVAPKDGLVVIDDFAEIFGYMLQEHGSPAAVVQSNPDLVNAVTKEYFEQFYDLFHENEGEVVDVSQAMKHRMVDMKAHIYRLNKVLEVSKNRDQVKKPLYERFMHLCLLAHYDCIPSDSANQYVIELERLKDPRDGIEWTLHLEEKTWWNPHGWARVLEALYGRKDS